MKHLSDNPPTRTNQRFHRAVWSGMLLALLLLPLTLMARDRLLFNEGWSFTQGDPEGTGEALSYQTLKPWLLPLAAGFTTPGETPTVERPEGNIGADVAHTQPGMDDTAWRTVDLPHDWAIEGPFKQEYPGETGKLKWWGPVWYRKHFDLPKTDAGRHIHLEVEGAMSYASVWCNGRFVGGWPYGYASWRVDLTPHLNIGAENVIAIRLDSPKESSRWYPGAGLYRNVWLVKTAPVQIGQWGTFITFSESVEEGDGKPSGNRVNSETTVENHGDVEAVIELQTTLCDPRGKTLDTQQQTLAIPVGESRVVRQQFPVDKPQRWSPAMPHLYRAVSRVIVDGDVVDAVETPFGLRTFRFTADNGLILNGQPVPIRGVCNHHDLGALGAAFNVRAAERQLEILKAMGCNAIRTAHNPPAPELLDLCDRMGFLVMDEAFDCWSSGKKPEDYHVLFPDWHEADLRALVRRDRNHPSVILWSTGNEMPVQRRASGVALSRKLTAIVKEEDPTRPVTAGCNHVVAGFNGFQETLDVFGYNYKPHVYGRFHATNAAIPVYGSETSSTVSSRGEYFFPVTEDQSQGLADFQVSSYDLYAPKWATTADQEFRAQDEHPFVAGEFVWTGFDYLGEPTPYNADLSNLNNYSNPEDRKRAEKELAELGKIRTLSRSSYFGIVDLAGFPKDRYYLYQARWRPELRMAHILPHWNWPDRLGQVTPVHVYTSGDAAELFLNGTSLGRREKGAYDYRLRWNDVVYEPGELKVVAYKNGREWATQVTKTTGPATQLLLEADHTRIAADGRDLSFVTVTVADRDEVLVPRSDNDITFRITGPGEIVATDNGDPTSFESFQSPKRRAFNGLALVVVRAKPGVAGNIILTAESDGLESRSITLRGVKP